MDPEFLKREDRFARHILTGMIASACTWAMAIFGLSDTVIPYLLPVVLLLSLFLWFLRTKPMDPNIYLVAGAMVVLLVGLVPSAIFPAATS
jgi:lipoprotein